MTRENELQAKAESAAERILTATDDSVERGIEYADRMLDADGKLIALVRNLIKQGYYQGQHDCLDQWWK